MGTPLTAPIKSTCIMSRRTSVESVIARPARWAGLRRVAPFFLVGPISGPLLAGVVLNVKDGRPVLAGLYAIALIEYCLLLPALVAKLGVDLV